MSEVQALESKYVSLDLFDTITYRGIPDGYRDKFSDGMAYILDLIYESEPEDATNRGVSYWTIYKDEIVCAHCKHPVESNRENRMMLTNYCPHCGMQMKVEEYI